MIKIIGTFLLLHNVIAAKRKLPDTPIKLIKKLQTLRVIPNIVDQVSANVTILQVLYGNATVALGNRLTPVETLLQPTNVTWKAESHSLYTLAMIGPDVPTQEKPSDAEFKHWLVGNIPGNNLSKGETIDDYLGIGFDYLSGLHRFVFLLFKQPSDTPIMFQENDQRYRYFNLKRIDFSIKYFAEKYNLGYAIAVNLFKIKNEIKLEPIPDA